MTDSIYWYDFETTGTDPVLDRPLQFAGIRTDLNLKEIGEPQNVLSRPGRDVIPEPGALLVTGIRMSEVVAQGLNERDFTEAVLAQFQVPQTCVTGFNSIRFDDEFTRQMLYRNFHDPYAREWRNGNSRWDVIDLFRAAYALRPDGFEWPERGPGVPTFRLEELARANGIEHLDAHDALADVRATIEITRRLRAAQPRLYDFAWRLRDKKAVVQQLYPLGKQAVVHVSSMYPAAQGCTAVVLPICQHPTNNNAIVCFDLSHDPESLLQADAPTLSRLVFSRSDELEDDEQRIALKSVHINRSPIVAPLATLGSNEAQRLGIDLVQCQQHLEEIKGTAGLVEKIQEAYSENRFGSNDDPDFQLYEGGFFTDADRTTMNELIASEPDDLSGFDGRFQDSRLDEMLFRYRARNWPEMLNQTEIDRWQQHCLERGQIDNRRDKVEAELSELLASEAGERLAVLQDLREYLDGL